MNPHMSDEVAAIVNDFQCGHSTSWLAARYGKPRHAIEEILRKFTAPRQRGGYAAGEQE